MKKITGCENIAEIQNVFYTEYKKRYNIILPDVNYQKSYKRADLMAVDDNRYTFEFEIKVTCSDLYETKKKRTLTQLNEIQKYKALENGLLIPNFFSIIIPYDVYLDAPERHTFSSKFGFYTVRYDTRGRLRIREVHAPKMLRAEKINVMTTYYLAQKFNLKYWHLRGL